MREVFLIIALSLAGCATAPAPTPVREPIPVPHIIPHGFPVPCATQRFTVQLQPNGALSAGALTRLAADVDAARPCAVRHATLTGRAVDIETVRAAMFAQGFPPPLHIAAPVETGADRTVQVVIEMR